MEFAYLSHTPPSLPKGSLEPSSWKRARMPGGRGRAQSISGRLRSASDLVEEGVISQEQKGMLKDMIISGDQRLTDALEKYERGDLSGLQSLMQDGKLDRRSSLDLVADLGLDQLDLNLFPMDFGGGGAQHGAVDPAVGNGDLGGGAQFQFDDDTFDFGMDVPGTGPVQGGEGGSSYGGQRGRLMSFGNFFGSGLSDSIPDASMFGMGAERMSGLSDSGSIRPIRVDSMQPRSSSLSHGSGRGRGSTVDGDHGADAAAAGADDAGASANAPTSAPVAIPNRQAAGAAKQQEPKKNIGAYSPESRRARIAK